TTYAHPSRWGHQQFLSPGPAGRAAARSSTLQFSPAICTKFVCVWVRAATGRTSGCGPVLTRGNFAADQRVEIFRGFEFFDFLKDNGRFGVHFRPDLLVILGRKLAAFVFEVEILNIPENHLLLALKEIPLGLFDDSGFQCVVFAE